MRLRLAASGWIVDEPRGVRLRFWNDTHAGPPPDEICVERAVIPDKRPTWVIDSDPPSWLGAPADWWSAPDTIALQGDPLSVYDLGDTVEGVAFVYDGPRARVDASLDGVSVWTRVVDPTDVVHVTAPCDRLTIRAIAAVLRDLRVLDPVTHATDLDWTPIATVLVRVGLGRPWRTVEPRASSLLALGEDEWRLLADTVATSFDRTLPPEPTVEQAAPELALGASWSIAALCGFGFRDGPGAWAELDDVDGAALLADTPSAPLAYRIVDPSGSWASSAPMAVPAGPLRDLAPARPPSVTASVSLAPDDQLCASRTLVWRLDDPLADRAQFEEHFGKESTMPSWETRRSAGRHPDDPDVLVTLLPCSAPDTALVVRQRNGDPWGRWTSWSEEVATTPTPDHHPSPPPLLAARADTGAITLTLGTVDPDPAPPWRLDRLALALHGRLEVLRRRSPPETVEIELATPVEIEADLWRYRVAPPIDPASFVGGVVNTGGVRCDLVAAEPDSILVRATNDGASRRRVPAPGGATLAARRDRSDLWDSVGEIEAPTSSEFDVTETAARGGATYALRVVYDGGRGPLGNEVRCEAAVATPPVPPAFRARFRAFDADHHAVFVVAFAEPPGDATLRIGWTWTSDGRARPRYARESLVALDASTFLARLEVPDRSDVLEFVSLWAAHETAAGIGEPVRGKLEPLAD